jgi:hypothetical protein
MAQNSTEDSVGLSSPKLEINGVVKISNSSSYYCGMKVIGIK